MYTAYFGFREEPFTLRADPRFFYTNAACQTAYAGLRRGLHERQRIMVLLGEVGSGKTTLLRRLMHDLEATAGVVFLAYPTLTFDEFLTAVCYELQVPIEHAGHSQKIQALHACLEDLSQAGRPVVLLIDEAQGLSEEVLEHLWRLARPATVPATSLQIVLAGQPEFETRLAHARLRQLNQDIAVRCRLERLTDDEVAAYIRHRLRLVGYEQPGLFSAEAIQRIARYARGTPRVINTVCDHALLYTCSRSQQTVSAEVIDAVAADLQYVGPAAVAQAPAVPIDMVGEPGHAPRLMTTEDGPTPPGRWHLARGRGIDLLSLVLLGGLVIAGARLTGLGRHSTQFGEPTLTPPVAVQTSRAEGNPSPAPTVVATLSATAFPAPSLPAASAAQDRRIKIPPGATVLHLAAQTYGKDNALLGTELIAEANPQIANLNVVRVGEELRLPLLTRDTLLRRQPDSTYHLLLGSFSSLQKAQQFAQDVHLKGYPVMVYPKQIANNLQFFRVAIGALPTLEAAQRVWNTALTQHPLLLPRSP